MNDDPQHTTTIEPRGMADADYRKKRRQLHKPFNFELKPDRREQLRKVAEKRGISMGAALRQLITAAFTMEIQKRPVCASGGQCFMPHMHPQEAQNEQRKEAHP